MKFLVQRDEDVMDIENILLIEQLKRNKYIHSFEEATLNELKHIPDRFIENNMIPVGTIEFVTLYLHRTQGFIKENPIEIPKYLRTEEFLHRDYNIVTWDNIPRSGRYFIKNASTLKQFSYTGNLEYFIQEDMFEEPKNEFDSTLRLSKDDLYQVSEAVEPLSEYRVYVVDHQVQAVSNYDGDPTIFPDMNVVLKAIESIEEHEKELKSYIIDVMVTKQGTCLLEIHNFTSCGLYTTLWDYKLLQGYIDGINYLLKDNKKIEV